MIVEMASSRRRPEIDGLRNLAICYLFVFHTARVFDATEGYYVEGTPAGWTTFLVQASPWFMPLLFVLAGMSSRFALARRPLRAYLRERWLRLGVPLAFGLVVLVPPQAFIGMLAHQGTVPAYPAFLAGYVRDWSDLSGYHGSFTPGQLWFLLFLLVISLAVGPVMARFPHLEVAGLVSGARLVVVPVAGLGFLGLAPDLGGKNLLVDAGWVLLGWVLAKDEAVADRLAAQRHAWGATAAVGLTAVALLIMHGDVVRWSGATAIALDLGYLAVVWVAVLAALGYGRRHLTGGGVASQWLSRAGMPVYVLHQTVLVAVAYVVVARSWPVPVAYGAIALGSAALTFGLYAGLVRVPGAAFLLGAKPERRTPMPVDGGASRTALELRDDALATEPADDGQEDRGVDQQQHA